MFPTVGMPAGGNLREPEREVNILGPVAQHTEFRMEAVLQWSQFYDPFGRCWLSTIVAALPIVVLLGLLAGLKIKPHWCAMAGAMTAIGVAIVFFHMPFPLAAMSFGYGVAFG